MKKLTVAKQLLILSIVFVITVAAPFRNVCVKAVSTNVEQTNAQLNVKISKSLVLDTTFTLKVYNLEENQKAIFKSSSSGIASIDKEGEITAKKIGSATITVSIKEGFKTVDTLQCDILVGPPAISIKLTKSSITLEVDKKVSLKAILKPNNTVEEPRFTSSNPAVAVVNSSGRVTAKAAGEAYISAMVGDNKCDTCLITVVEEEPTVELERAESAD